MIAKIGIFLVLVFAGGGVVLAQTPARQEEPVLEATVDETTVAETGDETSEEAKDEEAKDEEAKDEEAKDEEAKDEEAKDEEKVELPDIDVWSSEDEDDDVFVPTESISADASIAFPVDI
jgi:hypothetical protein